MKNETKNEIQVTNKGVCEILLIKKRHGPKTLDHVV